MEEQMFYSVHASCRLLAQVTSLWDMQVRHHSVHLWSESEQWASAQGKAMPLCCYNNTNGIVLWPMAQYCDSDDRWTAWWHS